jgi:hypothetical protein
MVFYNSMAKDLAGNMEFIFHNFAVFYKIKNYRSLAVKSAFF